MTTTTDPRVEAAADALAKHDGWISLSHPSPATQEKIRARAAVFLASVDAVDPLRKPRTITTVEELDALPDHAIIRDDCGPMERYTSAWSGKRGWYIGDNHATPMLPALVLWEPEA